jgi:hypothetical protein
VLQVLVIANVILRSSILVILMVEAIYSSETLDLTQETCCDTSQKMTFIFERLIHLNNSVRTFFPETGPSFLFSVISVKDKTYLHENKTTNKLRGP